MCELRGALPSPPTPDGQAVGQEKKDRRERIATQLLSGIMAENGLRVNPSNFGGWLASSLKAADALIAELDKDTG